MKYVTTQTNFKGIMLNEKCHSQKITYCMTVVTCSSLKDTTTLKEQTGSCQEIVVSLGVIAKTQPKIWGWFNCSDPECDGGYINLIKAVKNSQICTHTYIKVSLTVC